MTKQEKTVRNEKIWFVVILAAIAACILLIFFPLFSYSTQGAELIAMKESGVNIKKLESYDGIGTTTTYTIFEAVKTMFTDSTVATAVGRITWSIGMILLSVVLISALVLTAFYINKLLRYKNSASIVKYGRIAFAMVFLFSLLSWFAANLVSFLVLDKLGKNVISPTGFLYALMIVSFLIFTVLISYHLDFAIIKYGSLILTSIVAVLPVASCLITAFKTEEEYTSTNVMVLPESWLNFDNFKYAWSQANMLIALRNSIIILVLVVTGSVLIGATLAYVLNRFAFHGNGFIRNLFLLAAIIPGIATQVTVYSIMTQLGLVSSIPGYCVLMMGTDIISIYIFLQFFENISVSLDESAIIDGATYFQVFVRVLFPLLKPAVLTVMILKGVNTYNEYYMANLYLQDRERMVTLSTALYKFSGPMGNQYNYICAGLLISLIPALIVFISCQKQIYSGLTLGAVKG